MILFHHAAVLSNAAARTAPSMFRLAGIVRLFGDFGTRSALLQNPRYLALMRITLALCLILASQASAWEFSSTPICTLTDSSSETALRITYDGSTYRMDLNHPSGWPAALVFSIHFAPYGPVISTTQHSIDETTLSVADSGFGNVFLGLENNTVAIAHLGELTRVIDLADAKEPVTAFRACRPAVPTS